MSTETSKLKVADVDPLSNNVRRETLGEQVYATLLGAIVSGNIAPGERVKLEDMAARMGVSMTPLRQALVRLRTEGILRGEPRRGLYVASVSPEAMAELYDARLMCEEFAAERAAPAVSQAELRKLRKLVERHAETASSDTPNRIPWAACEVDLHTYIVDLAHNPRISSWFRTLGVHLQSEMLVRVPSRRDEVAVTEHWAIYEAFAARDAVRAKGEVTRHIQNAKAFVLRVMGYDSGSHQS